MEKTKLSNGSIVALFALIATLIAIMTPIVKLNTTITELNATLENTNSLVTKISDKVDDHEIRLIKLEEHEKLNTQ